MRAAPLFLLLVLTLVPSPAPGQAPAGVLVPAGARVRAEPSPPAQAAEGMVLGWRGDTLLVQAQAGGDTVRIAGAALKKLRVLESPALWRYNTTTDITFHWTVRAPPSGDTVPGAERPDRSLLLLGTKEALAALDPATGTVAWTRPDLSDVKPIAVDVLGMGLAAVTRGEQIEVIDLGTGAKRWDTGALSFLAALGWLPFRGDSLILMYGRTAESPWTLMAVNAATGQRRWRQDGLFATDAKVFRAGGASFLLGNQLPLADSDSTVVLYLSTDGPMRLDARSGARLWRADALRGAKVPTLRDGYASLRARRGVIYVPVGDSLVALRSADGAPAWTTPYRPKHEATWLDLTGAGLLVYSRDWVDLLDPATGRSAWRAPVQLKNARGTERRGDTVYALLNETVVALQVREGTVRTIGTVRFKAELPSGFTVRDEGMILDSWHNLALVDRQGTVRYHRVYPSPKQNLGEALGSAGGAAIRRPTTRWAGGRIFFFTGEPDTAGREGFSVVKVDPVNGHEEARVWFAERVPQYGLDPGAARAYYQRDDRTLEAVPFPDPMALAQAARSGQTPVVQRLLAMGVKAGAATTRGWTALHHAAWGGHVDVVRVLLDGGAPLDAKTADGWTPWMLAVRQGHDTAARGLRDAGAEASDAAAGALAAWHLAAQGRVAEALAASAQAAALDSTLVLWPAVWQAVCWNGGLADQAAAVLALCERAVEGTPSGDPRHGATRLARALARALTGDYDGAATDLAASTGSPGEDGAGVFEAWIDLLRERRNPFTPDVRASLRRR